VSIGSGWNVTILINFACWQQLADAAGVQHTAIPFRILRDGRHRLHRRERRRSWRAAERPAIARRDSYDVRLAQTAISYRAAGSSAPARSNTRTAVTRDTTNKEEAIYRR
jgi:hypothetical protein